MSWVNRTIDDQNGDSVTGEQVSHASPAYVQMKDSAKHIG